MADTEGGNLLSTLCTICHMEVPKYRCPRCSTRTCSLKCTQKHKKWSQCSGVRDPTIYLRRNKLATPAAFDRDFNFITSIERGLERAERDAENRGIPMEHDYVSSLEGKSVHGLANGFASKKRKRPAEYPEKGESGFLRAISTSGVKLIRAPKGMTRSKQNASRWHQKHKCISWTIEWIRLDDTKVLRNSVETLRISDAYDNTFAMTNDERQMRKQQQNHATQGSKSSNTSTNPQTTTNNLIKTKADEPNHGDMIDVVDQSRAPALKAITNSANSSMPIHDGTSTGSVGINEIEQEAVTAHRGVYFYISCPRTSTKATVLAPLSPNTTFQTSLRNRTILEFPTIYVLPLSPTEISEQLNERFLLQNQNHQAQKSEDPYPKISGDLAIAHDKVGDEEGNINPDGLSSDLHLSKETTSQHTTKMNSGSLDGEIFLQALEEDLLNTNTL